MDPISIQVVGGSLGGLTAACLLRDDGHDVTIYERSSRELEERGAGIGFLPATAKYLVERAGLDISEISVSTDHIRYLDRSGSVTLDQRHRYLFSSWNTVYRRLLAWFGAERYELDHELVDFAQDASSVTATYANGQSVATELLVAADGIGSIVRARLQPDANATFAGYVAWRGIVAMSELPAEIVDQLAKVGPGDASAGRHVFAKANCAVCHRMGNQGQAGGPDLTNMTARFSLREAVEATIDPSAVVSKRYQTKEILTVDGITYQGVEIDQVDGNYVLLGKQGKRIRIDANDVQEVKSNEGSAMPEGMLDGLSMTEIRDLMAYLTRQSESTLAEDAGQPKAPTARIGAMPTVEEIR